MCDERCEFVAPKRVRNGWMRNAHLPYQSNALLLQCPA